MLLSSLSISRYGHPLCAGVPTSGRYDPKLRTHLKEIAAKHDIRLTEGVYLASLGPSFETPAEIRAFKTLGADVVGMSLVCEVCLPPDIMGERR